MTESRSVRCGHVVVASAFAGAHPPTSVLNTAPQSHGLVPTVCGDTTAPPGGGEAALGVARGGAGSDAATGRQPETRGAAAWRHTYNGIESAQERGERASAATAAVGQLGEADSLSAASVEFLAGLATGTSRGIMEAVRSKTSKLNKDEIAAIDAHTERLGAVVTHLMLRLAAAEAAMQRRAAAGLGRDSVPVPIARAPGPSVAMAPIPSDYPRACGED